MLLMWNCVRGTIVMSLWYATSLHYKIKTSIQSFFQFSLISCFWNKPENRICVLKCFHILKIVNISQQSRQQCSFLKVTERQTGNPERFSFQVKSNVEFRMRIFRLWHKFYLFKMTSVFSNFFLLLLLLLLYVTSCTSFSYVIAANTLNKILVPEVSHLLWRALINSSSWGGRRFSVDYSLSTHFLRKLSIL